MSGLNRKTGGVPETSKERSHSGRKEPGGVGSQPRGRTGIVQAGFGGSLVVLASLAS